MPLGKRAKTAIDSSHLASAKRPLLTPSHTPASFPPLRVTKPLHKTQANVCTKKNDDTSFLLYSSHNPGHQCSSPIQESSNTIERLTPRPTDTYSSLIALSSDGTIPETVILETSDDTHDADSDGYPLDEGIADDDLDQLLSPNPEYVRENHIPPSSVQGWDHGSQSAAEYDPTLKFTPPSPREEVNNDTNAVDYTPGTLQINDTSEDLLDEDVDWNVVLADTNIPQGTPPSPITSLPGTEIPRCATQETDTQRFVDCSHNSEDNSLLTAFTRPPFPYKVRDRPSIPGLSSDTILRTCFRTGAMISQTACHFNHQQSVIFELYARVTYSSREALSRKQHFQFVDLFKDQQPYPAATLTNWRADSQIDIDGARFLDTRGGPRLCWCMCRPVRDTKAAIGWTYTVLKIREIGWEEIRWAKRIICGDSDSSEGSSTITNINPMENESSEPS